MNTSQLLQLAAIFVSLFASVSAIHIANKNIQLASRPYISVYIEFIDTVTASKYVVIKNFGKSAAKITSIKYSREFKNGMETNQLESLVGGTIAPSQKFMSFVDNDFKDSLDAIIEYKDLNGKKYTETFPLKLSSTDELMWVDSNAPYKRESDSTETVAIRAAAHLITKHLD